MSAPVAPLIAKSAWSAPPTMAKASESPLASVAVIEPASVWFSEAVKLAGEVITGAALPLTVAWKVTSTQ